MSNINAQTLDTNMTQLNCESWNLRNSIYKDNLYFDKAAEYPGGEREMNKFIYDSLSLPKNVVNRQGIYFVFVYLDSLGFVRDACIFDPPNPYPYGKAIIDRMRKMPKWEPAVKNQNPIASHVYIPVKFCIGR